ncbi:MAG TPA: ABC-F family ATP-binding cassette domain-containing protein [Gemmatimonadaceae bacterium]|nr:ABC-F family ATP-binding cassette domain-containing protein [Gemmatimonadaceae bacterium]
MTQLSVSGVGVEFGATTLFTDITFTVAAGERWGVVGRNGTGKTTLFKLLTGALEPTKGAIVRQPGLRVTMLEQHRDFAGASTVWEAAAGQFAHLVALEQSLADQAANLEREHGEQALARYARDLERFEREGGYTFAPQVDAVLHGLGFDPVEARTRPLDHLSGGERGRVGLARQLVSPSDVLLLDEPTNHLDLETTRWLERYLASSDKTVLLVSHDRAFLAAVADHILHFEGATATPYSGGYEAFVEQRILARTTQLRQFEQQSKKISAEEDYIRRNIAGQNSRQAKGRRKRLERLPRLSPPVGDEATMAVRFEASERGGDQVAVLDRVTIDIGGRTLIKNAQARLLRGDRVGLVGPNGAGKSTLLRTMLGERESAEGVVRLGASTSVAYYRQDLAQVPLDRPIYDVIADQRPHWERRLVQGHLGRFGFSGDEVQRKADSLSGGERARVALAMLMLQRANLLILDEPTNHLDVESIEALEDAMERYDGTILLVSHDRALLRAAATKVWVLHDGHLTVFDGSFAEWEVASEEREHAARVQAEEEEALRRVKERQKVRREASDEGRGDARKVLRRLERELAEAEATVATWEERVATLTGALEDPDLYTSPDGVAKATRLGQEVERARASLDEALEAWARATEALEEVRAAAGG